MPIPVDPLADEIVLGGVAQVDHDVGDRLVQVDEAVWEGMTVGHGGRTSADDGVVRQKWIDAQMGHP